MCAGEDTAVHGEVVIETADPGIDKTDISWEPLGWDLPLFSAS